MIYVFGHSIMGRKKGDDEPDTFMDILASRYDVCHWQDNFGDNVVVCSEERILYFLKKAKDLSLAVIFHANPKFYFNPYMDRDSWVDKDPYLELEQDSRQFNFYPDANRDRFPAHREHDISISSKAAAQPMQVYENFYHSPDLARNRFQGALVLIDQYCTRKRIPVIHLVVKQWMPEWFEFSSGIVDYDIQIYHWHKHRHYTGRWRGGRPGEDGRLTTRNHISPEGNMEIADILSGYIDRLRAG